MVTETLSKTRTIRKPSKRKLLLEVLARDAAQAAPAYVRNYSAGRGAE